MIYTFYTAEKTTVLLTGNTGNGKSEVGNFYMQRNFFKAECAFLSVSKRIKSGVTTIGGKQIEFIDTPGHLDPLSVDNDDKRLEFARGLMKIKSGIHMIGLVYNVTKRVDVGEDKIFGSLLSTFKHYLPYIVLIFTHGMDFGATDDEQKSKLEDMIKNLKEKGKNSNLYQVLEKINHRYIILESVKSMGRDYHAKKSKELIENINAVVKCTKMPANNNFMLLLAKDIEKAEACRDEVEKELANGIKTAQEIAKKDQSGGGNFYLYLGCAIIIAAAAGGKLAPIISPSTASYAISTAVQALGKTHPYVKTAIQAAEDHPKLASAVHDFVDDHDSWKCTCQ